MPGTENQGKTTPSVASLFDDPPGRKRFLRRKRRVRRRKVNYAELLRVPEKIPAKDQCPHTTRPARREDCSQCQGVRAKRVTPSSVPSNWVEVDFGGEDE